jgi:hypothetical protein
MSLAPSSPRFTAAPKAGGRMYQLMNSGPKLRQDILALEKAFNYRPVFRSAEPAKDSAFELASNLAYNVSNTMERLRYLESNEGHIESPMIKSPAGLTPVAVNRRKKSWFSSLFNASERQGLSLDEKKDIALNVSRLSSLITCMAQLWNLELVHTDNQGYQESALTTLDPSDEQILYPVAPGVYAPEQDDSIPNVLTSRGRFQVKRGNRKCSAENVRVLPSMAAKAKLLVREDEVEPVVRFLSWLAVLCEQRVHALI